MSQRNQAKCENCGKAIIVPNVGDNYGSTRNLRKHGFTGDIDPATGKAYCSDCMKKLGWQWGQPPEREEKE